MIPLKLYADPLQASVILSIPFDKYIYTRSQTRKPFEEWITSNYRLRRERSFLGIMLSAVPEYDIFNYSDYRAVIAEFEDRLRNQSDGMIARWREVKVHSYSTRFLSAIYRVSLEDLSRWDAVEKGMVSAADVHRRLGTLPVIPEFAHWWWSLRKKAEAEGRGEDKSVGVHLLERSVNIRLLRKNSRKLEGSHSNEAVV